MNKAFKPQWETFVPIMHQSQLKRCCNSCDRWRARCTGQPCVSWSPRMTSGRRSVSSCSNVCSFRPTSGKFVLQAPKRKCIYCCYSISLCFCIPSQISFILMSRMSALDLAFYWESDTSDTDDLSVWYWWDLCLILMTPLSDTDDTSVWYWWHLCFDIHDTCV